MTRTEAKLAVAQVLSGTGTYPTPQNYAELVLTALDEALRFDSETAQVEAICFAAGILTQNA